MTPYHDPTKFGLTMVGSIDFGHDYDFDIVAVFRTADGRLAYLDDSGCSCPMPFENKGIDDLTFCTPNELQGVLKQTSEENADLGAGTGRHDAAIAELMKRVVA